MTFDTTPLSKHSKNMEYSTANFAVAVNPVAAISAKNGKTTIAVILVMNFARVSTNHETVFNNCHKILGNKLSLI